jgi:hypothetical protein
MEIEKVIAGEYKVTKENVSYYVVKNSYLGVWSIYTEPDHVNCLLFRNTKKECLDYIEQGSTVKILNKVSFVPTVGLDTYFYLNTLTKEELEELNSPRIRLRSKNLWKVEDVLYSSKYGKWIIKGIHIGNYNKKDVKEWDYADFTETCIIYQPLRYEAD